MNTYIAFNTVPYRRQQNNRFYYQSFEHIYNVATKRREIMCSVETGLKTVADWAMKAETKHFLKFE